MRLREQERSGLALAKRIGLSHSTIANCLSDARPAGVPLAKAVAAALGVPLDKLAPARAARVMKGDGPTRLKVTRHLNAPLDARDCRHIQSWETDASQEPAPTATAPWGESWPLSVAAAAEPRAATGEAARIAARRAAAPANPRAW